MTPRERTLLRLLGFATAAAGLLLGLSTYLDELSRLDTAFIALQKRALRITQTSLRAESSGSTSSLRTLRDRFYTPGTLPDPLSLAVRVQAVAKESDLGILESRVTENSPSSQWILYHAEGPIESWFRFMQLLRGEDPKTLFRTLSVVKKQGFSYALTFEVGHAVLP